MGVSNETAASGLRRYRPSLRISSRLFLTGEEDGEFGREGDDD